MFLTPSAGSPDRRILIVDHDPVAGEQFQQALLDAGFEVVAAHDGAAALKIVATEPLSLVLVESRLDGMSGQEVLEQIRAQPGGRLLPIISVTGADELED